MKKLFALCLLASAALTAQQIPGATELPNRPFFIKKTWFIGGAGNWDYLTMDPAYEARLVEAALFDERMCAA